MKQLLSRKFLLAAFGLVSSAALAAFSHLTGEYVTVVVSVVGAFNAADTLITRKAIAAGVTTEQGVPMQGA